MNRAISLLLLLRTSLLLLLPFSLTAARAADVVPKEIAVGDSAPSFTLSDQNDKEFSLAENLKHGPVAVVFIRSIDWCSYCQIQAVQLSEHLDEIQATGGRVVIVCYDSPDKVKRFAQRRNLVVPVLSDADSKTIEAYAMRALRGYGQQIGSSQHGTFVVDQTGTVRSKPYLTSYEGDSAVTMLVAALKDAAKTKS